MLINDLLFSVMFYMLQRYEKELKPPNDLIFFAIY